MTIMKKLSIGTSSLATATLLSVLCPVGGAVAVEPSGLVSEPVTRSEIVRTEDLNLADPAGKRILKQRIENAAARACSYGGMWGVRPPRDYVACVDRALSGAHDQAARLNVAGEASPVIASAN